MKVNNAIVLAGGPASRLRPLSNKYPKAMVKVHEKPLLQWIIEWLRENNVEKIVIGVAFLKEKIIDFFGDGREFGMEIKYSVHSIIGETGEGFRLAIKRHVDQDTFFAMNGDQITDMKLSELASFHAKHRPTATIAVSNVTCPYGHVTVNPRFSVLGFSEKPICSRAMCNTGIYVFEHEIVDFLPEKGRIEDTTFPRLAKMGRLKAYPSKDSFFTVNTLKDLIDVERALGRLYE